jgi:hypothetical protein
MVKVKFKPTGNYRREEDIATSIAKILFTDVTK